MEWDDGILAFTVSAGFLFYFILFKYWSVKAFQVCSNIYKLIILETECDIFRVI